MKLNTLSYKQKNKYLLWGSLLFALIAYMTAIRTTHQLYQDNKVLATKIQRGETAPQGIAELRKSLENLNDKLDHYLIDTTKEQEHTLEVVSEFCHKKGLIVRELPRRRIEEGTDFTIVTSILKVEGPFLNLVRLLYELEYGQRLGRLSSVSWKSYVDMKTKRTILYMTVYLQNITINATNEHEKK